MDTSGGAEKLQGSRELHCALWLWRAKSNAHCHQSTGSFQDGFGSLTRSHRRPNLLFIILFKCGGPSKPPFRIRNAGKAPRDAQVRPRQQVHDHCCTAPRATAPGSPSTSREHLALLSSTSYFSFNIKLKPLQFNSNT